MVRTSPPPFKGGDGLCQFFELGKGFKILPRKDEVQRKGGYNLKVMRLTKRIFYDFLIFFFCFFLFFNVANILTLLCFCERSLELLIYR